MASSQWMILWESGSVRVGRAGADGAESVDVGLEHSDVSGHDAADRTSEALRSLGYSGEPVVLGIAAVDCFAVRLPLASRQQLRNRQAMLFAIEEHVPTSAEEMVADFYAVGDDAFAVGVAADQLLGQIDALESRGVVIQSIVPTAVLALQAEFGGDATHNIAVWAAESVAFLFEMSRGRPSLWRMVPNEPAAIERELAVHSLSMAGPRHLVSIGLAQDVAQRLGESIGAAGVEVRQRDLCEAAALSAAAIARGELSPWIELRRDRLASASPYRLIRGHVRYAAVSAAVLAALLVAALVLRAHRSGEIVRLVLAQQQSIYRQLFPNGPVPAGIRSRLESELAQLGAVSGESEEIPPRAPATAVLYEVLAAIPQDLRCRVVDLKINGGRFDLDGEVRSHGDADTLIESFGARGFTVPPPPTHNLPGGGVSVRITGELPPGNAKSEGTSS